MNEIIIELTDISPVDFFGLQNANIDLLKKYFPKLKIVARGTRIKAYGDEEELTEYLDDVMFDLDEGYESVEDYLSVVNQSDPDLETNYFMNKKRALDTISWRGFHRGDPDYNSCTWAEKQKKVEDLKKELEDNE